MMGEENAAAAAGGAMRAMTSPISTAFEAAITRLLPAAKGQTEQTRMMIAQMLMSRDPQALQVALRQVMGAQDAMRMDDGITRHCTRAHMLDATAGPIGSFPT